MARRTSHKTRMAPMRTEIRGTWEETKDRNGVLRTSTFRAGIFTIICTRYMGFDPDTWVMYITPITQPRECASKDHLEARAEAFQELVALCTTTLAEMYEETLARDRAK